MLMSQQPFFEFVIVGGGIAGVVCAETLCELIQPSRFGGGQSIGCDARVALISATPTVKTTVNLRRITNMIESFDVSETSADVWSETWPGTLEIFCDTVTRLDPSLHLIYLKKRGADNPIRYGRLCLTTGAVPRLVAKENPLVIGLRDTESLATFQKRLRDARRLVLVGNGGIATEIAHEVTGCQIVWAIKDNSISTPFLDPAAAKFLLNARELAQSAEVTATSSDGPSQTGDTLGPVQIRRMRYVVAESSNDSQDNELVLVPVTEGKTEEKLPNPFGAAMGPDWAHGRSLRGCLSGQDDRRLMRVVYNVKIESVLTAEEFQGRGISPTEPFPEESSSATAEKSESWPVYVLLTNGEAYGCDLVISAVGVEASFQPCRAAVSGTTSEYFGAEFELAPPSVSGGGVLINDQMETSVPDIYAAGDCAYANWTWAPHWFQMRLWSQARQMGFQAAKTMFGHNQGTRDVPLDFSFELFSHVTYFFGFKVVLLGLYNGQGLDLTSPDCYLLMRVTPGREYVKCVMQAGKMQGALLIGDTDLEETLENLIVNQLDLTHLEDSLLNPDIDLSDYFD